MTPNPPPDEYVKMRGIVDAALKLAAQLPWDFLTHTDIAREAGMSLADLRSFISDKNDILLAYNRFLDHKTLECVGEPDIALPEKDRLFDVIMQRFEIMQDNRAALKNIIKPVLQNPSSLTVGAGALLSSSFWMVEGAGLDTHGLRGSLRAIGLVAVYLATLRVWLNDETEDLAHTMAALDKYLDRGAQLASMMSL